MITHEIEKITPIMADKWLKENNTHNRSLYPRTIEKYAREMVAGAWVVTSQGIAFAEDGTLLDGQQRLSAIVMANIPIKILVVRGLPRVYRSTNEGDLFTQDVIDVNKPRTTGDCLAISHEVENASVKVAIVNMIVYAFKGVQKLSPRIALNILNLYEEEIEFTLSSRTQICGLSFTPALTGIVLAAKVDLDKAMDFKVRYFKGTNLKDGDPALAFRTFMLSRGGQGPQRGNARMTVLNYSLTALKCHFDEKPLQRIISSDKAREYFMSKQKNCVQIVMDLLKRPV